MTIGQPQSRIDGLAKVTGQARYAADFPVPNALHAVIVGANIPAGEVLKIESRRALAHHGVISVLTHLNIGMVHPNLGAVTVPPLATSFLPMQGPDIMYDGQPVAIAVAETLEAAEHAAKLIEIEYKSHPFTAPGSGSIFKPEAASYASFNALDFEKGNWRQAVSDSAIQSCTRYTQPSRHHNPMEPSAIIAGWQNDMLVVHDALQHPASVQAVLCAAFGLDASRVRVICPHTGGGFGAKAFVWPHEILTAMAAKALGRPVKTVLKRSQMYDMVGYQPWMEHLIELGADRTGSLLAVSHSIVNVTSMTDDYVEFGTVPAKHLYAAPAIKARQRLQRANINLPTFMRSPVDGPGSYAVGCAMDELARSAGIDPLDLRLINHADVDPSDDRDWSSKKLKEAYEIGARRFNWRERPRGGLLDGNWSVGYGMADCTQGQPRFPSNARIRLRADGTATVEAAFADIGTGGPTIFAQIAGDILGLPACAVSAKWGDTELPYAAPTYGQTSTVSVGASIRLAALDARQKLIRCAQLSIPDDQVNLSGAVLYAEGLPENGLSFSEAMSRAGLSEIVGEGVFQLPGGAPIDGGDGNRSSRTFGVIFIEVGVDRELGLLRLRRAVGAYSAGRIINPMTARSQMIGGIVWGWGMAALEASHYERDQGRWLCKDLAGVSLPVSADIPSAIEVEFVDEFDKFAGPLGAKGIGELGATGVAAAVANAVYDATGIRVRDLPITPDKLVKGAVRASAGG
jgi:xanthine dehydrogenase YagR molybdenum-binding subunit